MSVDLSDYIDSVDLGNYIRTPHQVDTCRMSRIITTDEEAAILDLLEQGLTYIEVGEKIGRSRYTVRNVADRSGCVPRVERGSLDQDLATRVVAMWEEGATLSAITRTCPNVVHAMLARCR